MPLSNLIFRHPSIALEVKKIKIEFRAINTRFRSAFGLMQPLSSTTYSELGGSFCKKHAVTPPEGEAPTRCKYMVSGLFHSPQRGSFHLSLTVLVHYRSIDVFSLRRLFCSPPGFKRACTCLALLRSLTNVIYEPFVYTTLTFCGGAFQPPSTRQYRCTFRNKSMCVTYNPRLKTGFGLLPFRSPLLREYS